jgi:DNA-binding transcriptional ArsR family regulator
MSLRSSGNPYGDHEITEPGAMRALAHPVRLAILSRLQGHGPATATELSEHVDASPSVVSWHLRHLATFGLVRDSDAGGATGRDGRKRYWESVARGFRFEFADDEEGLAASRVLSRSMFDQAADLPARWAAETEPALEPRWRREAGLSNTTFHVTARELAAVNAAIEQVLAPYVTRAARDRPARTRPVRMIRYVLPGAADDEREVDPS